MGFHKCTKNPKIRCWIHSAESRYSCPAEDEEWIEVIDRWALDRDVGCVDWGSARGTQPATDDKLVSLCDINQVLEHPCAVMDWSMGVCPMSKEVCKDLVRGQILWHGINMGFSRVNEVKRVDNRYSELREGM